MNSHVRPLLVSVLCLAPAVAEPPGIDQSLELVMNQNDKPFILWHGKPGRSYFVQISDPADHLKTWHYAPFCGFGIGIDIDCEVDGTPDKNFFRLLYVDDPSVTTLEQAKNADFDHDGVSNINEIAVLGTDPFLFATNGGAIGDGAQDWDNDGISNADEFALGLDPKVNNTTPAAGAATLNYGYDDAHRLLTATSPVSSQSFTPDQEGNLQ